MISRSSRRPPSPAPTIRTVRASLRRPRAAQRALVGGVHDEARAAEEDEHQQAVEDEHARRDVDRHEAARRREQQLRLHHHDVGDEREHAGQRGLRDPQVLALRRVAHPVPVDAEQREDRDAADDREPERAHEQVVVEVGHAAGSVEAEAVGEEVGQRDQPGVQRDLRSGVAMDGKGRGAEPAAHQRILFATTACAASATSATCSRLSTGLIGIARWVRASSSVTGRSTPRGVLAHRGLAVGRHAVVGLVPDLRRLERGGEVVGAAGGARRRGARRACSRRPAAAARRPRRGPTAS